MSTMGRPFRGGLCKPLFLGLSIGMEPCAIGGFQDQQIAMFEWWRCCPQHCTLWGAADVAGDDDGTSASPEAEAYRAGDVSGAASMNGYPRQHRYSEWFLNGHGAHLHEHA